MRDLRKITLVLAIVAGGTEPLDAQFQAGREPFFKLRLLNQKSVRGELKLSKDQAKDVDTFTDKWKKALRELYAAPASQRRKKLENLAMEVVEFITTTLNKQQADRLAQLYYQLFGILIISTDGSLQKALQLTDEQKEALRPIEKDAREAMLEIGGMKDYAAGVAKLAAYRKRQEEQVMSLLTDEQKKRWKERIGKPFEGKLDPLALFGPAVRREANRP